MENGGYLLPEYVIFMIMSWLPVKTLLQFKCVCKSWYAIITSPDFISRHLSNYYNNAENDCLVAFELYRPCDVIDLYPDETLVDLSHEAFYVPLQGAVLCGPCNGLFYLDTPGFGDCGIWNPATEELKVLSPKMNRYDLPPNVIRGQDAFGFGLDPVTGDYKVVVVLQLFDEQIYQTCYPKSLIVYTLRTDSWKSCGYLAQDYYFHLNTCYTYASGVFYWMGAYVHKDENDEVVLSFDMATDVFQEIKVPDYEKPALERLALYHDSIAFLTVHSIEHSLAIWVMNEGCWVKQFSIGTLLGVQNPVGYWKNGKFFLESYGNQLILCDPIAQEFREVGFQAPVMCNAVVIYKESLVSVRSCSSEHEPSTEGDECLD